MSVHVLSLIVVKYGILLRCFLCVQHAYKSLFVVQRTCVCGLIFTIDVRADLGGFHLQHKMPVQLPLQHPTGSDKVEILSPSDEGISHSPYI